MSATKDRRRRPRNAPRQELQRKDQAPERSGFERRAIQPLPEWRWMTFPVFFALALGLFIGVYAGVLAAYANENGNGIPQLVVFLASAILLGTALSRLSTRWILSRRWARAKERGEG